MNSYIYHGISKISSSQTFEQYREAESYNQAKRAVNKDGDLLDYETLELRVHPPNIKVKIEENETLITLDSANRPGTLIEVVQCLTELGLSFTKARITSDGGWFVDEFYVHDSNGPVRDPKKVAAIEKVLNVNFELDEALLAASGMEGGASTVVELSGEDRRGLLADIMDRLSACKCSVWSASIWTAKERATFVLGVNDASWPLSDSANWAELWEDLMDMMGGEEASASVHKDNVKHPALVHHERRLHKLMLADEVALYEKDVERAMSSTVSVSSAADDMTHLEAAGLSAYETRYVPGSIDGPQQPDVKVTYAPLRKYWFVRIVCLDRNKLMFDLVCTFVDLDFDIYHATLDAEEQEDTLGATIEFYVRPRLGGPDYDAVKGRRLAEMLKGAIVRRVPKGLKLFVQTQEDCDSKKGSLAYLTRKLTKCNLTITRATVKPNRNIKGRAEHTLYVVDEHGDVPPRECVEAACQEANTECGLAGHKTFSYSCMERNWRKEWGVGSGSSTSSRAPILADLSG